MNLTKDDILSLAKTARIGLDESEAEALCGDLNEMLDMVRILDDQDAPERDTFALPIDQLREDTNYIMEENAVDANLRSSADWAQEGCISIPSDEGGAV